METMADYIYDQLKLMNQNYELILRNLEQRNEFITRRTISECLDVKPERASYIIRKMKNDGLIYSESKGRSTKYHFV